MNKISRTRIYLYVMEYTCIPLLIGFYLIYMSGKGLVNTELVKDMTLGSIGYVESIFLHNTSLLNYFVGLLVIIHSVCGLGLLINRKIGNNTLKNILEIIVVIVVGFVLVFQLSFLEFF